MKPNKKKWLSEETFDKNREEKNIKRKASK